MPDYNNTCIYKICCKDTDITDIYVGHTTNLISRKGKHKSRCNNEKDPGYNTYVYKFIRNNGGWDNWEIIKLYNHPCLSHKEASIEEKKCCKKLEFCKLNIQNPYRTIEERKENAIIFNKIYRKENSQKIKE